MQKLLILPLTLCAVVALAQPKQNSPYSRFGLGDPVSQVFAGQLAMGGMTAAYHDPYYLNISNPASFAFLRTATLETGLYAKSANYQSGDDKLTDWTGNLAYFALGFALKSPINEVMDKKKSPWQVGMGFALTPGSQVGYNIETADTLPDLGAITNVFQGTGGTYRLTWSNGIKYKRTAIGVNLGWMFGESTYENTTYFKDSLPTFSDNFRDEIGVGGFVWRAGVQHDFVLKYGDKEKDNPEQWITIGLSGAGNQTLSVDNTKLRVRSRGKLDNGLYRTPDTLLYEIGDKMQMTLPASFAAAVQYVNSTKFKAGVEYVFDKGTAFKNPARTNGTFRDASSVSGGIEFTPDYTSYNNYFKRIHYRLGGYYRQDIRVIDGVGLDDLGVSFGAGFPIILPRQQTSFINAAFEMGTIGADTRIKETYYRLTLGFTLNDNSWFYKRRFE